MEEHPDIHMPGPSFWPIALAAGLVLIAIGTVSNFIASIIGIIVLLVSIAGWTMENRAEELHHE